MRQFDYAKLKDRLWDIEVVNFLSQIHEAKGKQALYLKQKPEQIERLVEIAKIQSTEASNEIEGIRTTETRLRQLMGEKTTPRNRDEREIAGCRDALNVVHESFEYIPLTSNYIRTATNMYNHGWDERNGGNISLLLDEGEVAEYLDTANVIRKIPTGFYAPALVGKYFLVTGTGKYFKNVQYDPAKNLGLFRIAADGKAPAGRTVGLCYPSFFRHKRQTAAAIVKTAAAV